MLDWRAYNKMLSAWGATERDRDINISREDFAAAAIQHPAYTEALVNGKSIGMLIHSTQDLSVKTFDSVYDSGVTLGDIVNVGGIHWLVTEISVIDPVTVKGKIEQCNRQIVWQNTETLKIVSRWCIASKPYFSNITNTKYVDTSSREFKILVPYDDETKLVDVDKRFLMEVVGKEPKAYKCTSTDMITDVFEDLNRGFITWNFEQDQYNESTDNAELMIANYIKPPSTIDLVGTATELKLRGAGSIRAGSSCTYTASGAKTVEWTVSNCDGVTFEADGNKVRVFAAETAELGTRFTVAAVDPKDKRRIVSKTVKVVGLL